MQVQLSLPFEASSAVLEATLDDVRNRFGSDAVMRAALLDHHARRSTWLSPGEDLDRAGGSAGVMYREHRP